MSGAVLLFKCEKARIFETGIIQLLKTCVPDASFIT